MCDTAGDAILQHLSVSERIWNTDSSEYLGKKDNLIAALSISPEQVQSIKNLLQPNTNQAEIPKAYLNPLFPQSNPYTQQIVSKVLATFEAFVKRYNDFVKAEIGKIYDTIATIANVADKVTSLSEKIAFVWGMEWLS